MKTKLIILTGALALLGVSLRYFPYHCNCTVKSTEITLGGQAMNALIANTDALRTQGLSDRESLAKDTGMLFVFDTPGKYGIWMKDMNFPLDLVWINSEKKIIAIDHDVATSTYPSVFYPPDEVTFIVEIPAGYSQGHDIKVGESLLLNK